MQNNEFDVIIVGVSERAMHAISCLAGDGLKVALVDGSEDEGDEEALRMTSDLGVKMIDEYVEKVEMPGADGNYKVVLLSGFSLLAPVVVLTGHDQVERQALMARYRALALA